MEQTELETRYGVCRACATTLDPPVSISRHITAAVAHHIIKSGESWEKSAEEDFTFRWAFFMEKEPCSKGKGGCVDKHP